MSHLILQPPAVKPWALYDGDPGQVSNNGALVANTCYLVGVTLNVPAVLTALRMRFGAGGAGHYDIGIYDSGGNLLAHSGSTVSATGAQTYTLATPLGLAPGRYWLALWVDNATDTILRSTGSGNMNVTQSGTNATGLPSATSGITSLANAATRPVIIGILQGSGWS